MASHSQSLPLSFYLSNMFVFVFVVFFYYVLFYAYSHCLIALSFRSPYHPHALQYYQSHDTLKNEERFAKTGLRAPPLDK